MVGGISSTRTGFLLAALAASAFDARPRGDVIEIAREPLRAEPDAELAPALRAVRPPRQPSPADVSALSAAEAKRARRNARRAALTGS